MKRLTEGKMIYFEDGNDNLVEVYIPGVGTWNVVTNSGTPQHLM